jgi:hypothetical protein
MQKGFIEILKDSAKTVINQTSPPARRNLNQIEQLALDWHGNSRKPKEVFESNGLVRSLKATGKCIKRGSNKGRCSRATICEAVLRFRGGRLI